MIEQGQITLGITTISALGALSSILANEEEFERGVRFSSWRRERIQLLRSVSE